MRGSERMGKGKRGEGYGRGRKMCKGRESGEGIRGKMGPMGPEL